MYFSTQHWHRLANGYSGHYPDAFVELLHLVRGFPDEGSLAALRSRRVRYVLLTSEDDPAAYDAAVAFLRKHPAVQIMMHENFESGKATLVRIRGV